MLTIIIVRCYIELTINIKLFGLTKRTECLEQASAEVSITTQSIVN